jgi:hypothetical protein
MTTTYDKVLIEEEALKSSTISDEKFRELLNRLNKQSVEKHFEAYKDVNWDAPEMQIRIDDPVFELPEDDPLGKTQWYKSLSQEDRARLGLMRIATAAKVGLEFENVLKRGLLEYAFHLKNNDPSFRYIMHEVTEECHHSMMFQELVNRTSLDIKGLDRLTKIASYFVVIQAIFFPELFFLFVLGGEDPIDYVQRQMLRKRNNHPLLEQIMKIHVTEEARHLSFARHYLKNKVPKISRLRRARLKIAAPFLLWVMAAQMLYPSRQMIKEFNIPRNVLKEAYRSKEAKATVSASLAKIRRLFKELGLIGPVSKKIWQVLGIWAED